MNSDAKNMRDLEIENADLTAELYMRDEKIAQLRWALEHAPCSCKEKLGCPVIERCPRCTVLAKWEKK